jgi:hypothetical protein
VITLETVRKHGGRSMESRAALRSRPAK